MNKTYRKNTNAVSVRKKKIKVNIKNPEKDKIQLLFLDFFEHPLEF